MLLAIFCDCTGRFVSNLVGNPEDRFSRVAAHLLLHRLSQHQTYEPPRGKTNNVVIEQVRHKPACTSTAAG